MIKFHTTITSLDFFVRLLLTSRKENNLSNLPITTALAPAIGILLRFINSMHPFGVHGMKLVKFPIAVRPSLMVCKLKP